MGPLIVVTFLFYAWLEHTVLSNKEISWSFRVLASRKKKKKIWTSFPLGFYAGTRNGIFKPISLFECFIGMCTRDSVVGGFLCTAPPGKSCFIFSTSLEQKKTLKNWKWKKKNVENVLAILTHMNLGIGSQHPFLI